MRVWDLGFRVLGLGFKVSGFEFWLSVFIYEFWGFEFWFLSSGFRTLEFRIRGLGSKDKG